MENLIFLTWEELIAGHRDQLTRHGGQEGFIDEDVVRAAMARPAFKAQYDAEVDLADLAAAYLFALCTTQGFLDGNKRASVVAASVFVRKNGWRFTISEELIYIVSISVAATNVDEEMLARVLREHMSELK